MFNWMVYKHVDFSCFITLYEIVFKVTCLIVKVLLFDPNKGKHVFDPYMCITLTPVQKLKSDQTGDSHSNASAKKFTITLSWQKPWNA